MSKFQTGRIWNLISTNHNEGTLYQAGRGLADNFDCLKELMQDMFHEIHNTKDHGLLTEQLVKAVNELSRADYDRCVNEEFSSPEPSSELKQLIRL